MSAWVVGIGEAASPSKAESVDTLALGLIAARRALDDAGLESQRVDGILAFGLYGDLVPAEAIGYGLGCRMLRAAFDLTMGGQAPAMLTGLASQLILNRQAEVVLIVRSLRNGVSIGSAVVPRIDGVLRLSAGLSAYPVAASLWARRYLDAANLPDESLAEALFHAGRNVWPPGMFATAPADFSARTLPTSVAEYLESRLISSPLRRDDCVTEIDGAAAVVVTADAPLEDACRSPLRVVGSVWRSTDADVDMSSMLAYPDLSRNVSGPLEDALRSELGVYASDAEILSIYDCFSSVLLQSIEGLKLCEFGEGPQYLAELGRGEGSGQLINPGGGMLARGYLHGMLNLTDAIRAARIRQANHAHTTTIVVSGGMTSGSAVVLEG